MTDTAIVVSGGESGESELGDFVADNLLEPKLKPGWRFGPDDNVVVGSRVPGTLAITFDQERWFDYFCIDRTHTLNEDCRIKLYLSNVSTAVVDADITIELTNANGYINEAKPIPYHFSEFKKYKYARVEIYDDSTTVPDFHEINFLFIGGKVRPSKTQNKSSGFGDNATVVANRDYLGDERLQRRSQQFRIYQGDLVAIDHYLDYTEIIQPLAEYAQNGWPFIYCYDDDLNVKLGESTAPGARELEHTRVVKWTNVDDFQLKLKGYKSNNDRSDSERWDLPLILKEVGTIAIPYVIPATVPTVGSSPYHKWYFVDGHTGGLVYKDSYVATFDGPSSFPNGGKYTILPQGLNYYLALETDRSFLDIGIDPTASFTFYLVMRNNNWTPNGTNDVEWFSFNDFVTSGNERAIYRKQNKAKVDACVWRTWQGNTGTNQYDLADGCYIADLFNQWIYYKVAVNFGSNAVSWHAWNGTTWYNNNFTISPALSSTYNWYAMVLGAYYEWIATIAPSTSTSNRHAPGGHEMHFATFAMKAGYDNSNALMDDTGAYKVYFNKGGLVADPYDIEIT
jgi:hypothetical protein